MIPLNLLESITRTFSMFVRLFGNIMAGVFVIGIVASLAGLLVPIPLMALDLLTGAVQAYIFATLAIVFISAAVDESRPAKPASRSTADSDAPMDTPSDAPAISVSDSHPETQSQLPSHSRGTP
jgi:F-type H+-transporting ATPase subunit a